MNERNLMLPVHVMTLRLNKYEIRKTNKLANGGRTNYKVETVLKIKIILEAEL